MTRRKTWQKLQRLTRGIARSFGRRSSDHDIADDNHATTNLPPALQPRQIITTSAPFKPPNMADEEDFSSLPLTDRWVHKVRRPLQQRCATDETLTGNLIYSDTDSRFRFGKFEKQHTRKPRNNLKSLPMNTIPPSNPSFTIHHFGKALWPTAM